MKKKRLDVEFSYDFELLGVTSSAKGYKLAWDINQLLGIRLVKSDDLQVEQKSNVTAAYSCFAYESPLTKIRVFRNRPNDPDASKLFLVPEFSHMDYIIMVQGEEYTKLNRLHELLRNIPSIELVSFLPLSALKSKDNFIF